MPRVRNKNTIELDFPYELRNPVFTLDITPVREPREVSEEHLEFVKRVEDFCRSVCVCKSKKQYDTDENTSYSLAIGRPEPEAKMMYKAIYEAIHKPLDSITDSQVDDQQGKNVFRCKERILISLNRSRHNLYAVLCRRV